MKTRGEKAVLHDAAMKKRILKTVDQKNSRKRKINPNTIIVACFDIVRMGGRSLSSMNQMDLCTIGKRFKVKSDIVGKIVKSFLPFVRVKKLYVPKMTISHKFSASYMFAYA